MMQAIGDWLKNIIFVILIATFIELLLPNNKMERYVRTVVSLIILLVLITPVLTIFKKNWDPSALFVQAQQMQNKVQAEEQKQMKQALSLPEIMKKGDRLHRYEESEAEKLLNNRIASRIREGLVAKFSIADAAVTVKTAKDKEGSPYITAVTILLASLPGGQQDNSSGNAVGKETGSAETGGATSSIHLDPIQSLKVQMPDIHVQPAPSSAKRLQIPKKLKRNIIDWISQEWPVQKDHILIEIEGK